MRRRTVWSPWKCEDFRPFETPEEAARFKGEQERQTYIDEGYDLKDDPWIDPWRDGAAVIEVVEYAEPKRDEMVADVLTGFYGIFDRLAACIVEGDQETVDGQRQMKGCDDDTNLSEDEEAARRGLVPSAKQIELAGALIDDILATQRPVWDVGTVEVTIEAPETPS
ncbi:hypothetical protein LCGC14_1847350 [marine sediment metagenome]|uniref:Uncharacterized protein n=1 Tax=marine sediment metagenome TaxID=412755 RepID=A0A0F9IQY2_9ZZZZ